MLYFVAELTVSRYSRLVSTRESPLPSPVVDRVIKHMVEQQKVVTGSPWRSRRSRGSVSDSASGRKLKALQSDRLSMSLTRKDDSSPSPVSPQSPVVSRTSSVGESTKKEQTVDVSEQMKALLVHVTPLLSSLFTEFKPFLTKTLLGSQDQEIMNKGVGCSVSPSFEIILSCFLC